MELGNYKKIEKDIIEQIVSIVGANNVIVDREEMEDYSHDEYSLDDIREFPEVVVKPKNTKEVSQIAKLCYDQNIPLTARGGGTGLCGGCVPMFGGILLSFENMKQINEIDTKNLTATVEPGLMLLDFYPAVEKKGLFFPPHPGDESATIGGVIATNAGGARAVKYGVIRNFIKGIEVVLPDGDVITLGGKFIKDSSGYSLMHLMIGSEGTLGLITRATITLLPPPKVMVTLVAPYDNLHDAISTVPDIIQNKIVPMAIEFVGKEAVIITGEFLNRTWPCSQGEAHLMIIVDGSSEDEVMAMAETISEVCLNHNALDVFVADSKEKQHNILEIRSQIYAAMKHSLLEILDITVPRSRIAEFVDDIHCMEEEHKTWMPTYGHAADGNVHTHLMRKQWHNGEWKEINGWQEKYSIVRQKLHELGKEYAGIVSGEHGIGIMKKKLLDTFLSRRQINLMRAIKKTFDPKNILNPGKIFDLT